MSKSSAKIMAFSAFAFVFVTTAIIGAIVTAQTTWAIGLACLAFFLGLTIAATIVRSHALFGAAFFFLAMSVSVAVPATLTDGPQTVADVVVLAWLVMLTAILGCLAINQLIDFHYADTRR